MFQISQNGGFIHATLKFKLIKSENQKERKYYKDCKI